MDFTDDMIRDVLYALRHPEVRARHARVERSEPRHFAEQAPAPVAGRPAGRHYLEEPVMVTMPVEQSVQIDADAERRLAMVEQLSKEDELHTLTRDYIVAATNQVVRKLERAS
jgi:hypothetical protein